jgi:hypothetical protein
VRRHSTMITPFSYKIFSDFSSLFGQALTSLNILNNLSKVQISQKSDEAAEISLDPAEDQLFRRELHREVHWQSCWKSCAQHQRHTASHSVEGREKTVHNRTTEQPNTEQPHNEQPHNEQPNIRTTEHRTTEQPKTMAGEQGKTTAALAAVENRL